ncbi:hypothetical protein JM946_29830, partial [Steroidobacter sp. S1-65]
SREYEAPQGEVEEVLAGIWQELLHVERVGRQDNFFELGGHSLWAMQVGARLQSCLLIEVPIRALFDFPVLRDLAEHIEKMRRAQLIADSADGNAEAEQLLEAIASMSEDEVRKLLQAMKLEETT